MKRERVIQNTKAIDISGHLSRMAIRFLKWCIKRNLKTMSLLALDKLKIETDIDLIIQKNRQLESELAEWEKEL